MFTFKCEINHERKAIIITLLFAVSTMILAFILRIWELPMEMNVKINSKNLIDYGSAIWLTVITMTTVGYGDILAHTLGGQITSMIIALWGSFVVSLLILITSDIFNFNEKE
jgi:voltage-gated potassium channel